MGGVVVGAMHRREGDETNEGDVFWLDDLCLDVGGRDVVEGKVPVTVLTHDADLGP